MLPRFNRAQPAPVQPTQDGETGPVWGNWASYVILHLAFTNPKTQHSYSTSNSLNFLGGFASPYRSLMLAKGSPCMGLGDLVAFHALSKLLSAFTASDFDRDYFVEACDTSWGLMQWGRFSGLYTVFSRTTSSTPWAMGDGLATFIKYIRSQSINSARIVLHRKQIMSACPRRLPLRLATRTSICVYTTPTSPPTTPSSPRLPHHRKLEHHSHIAERRIPTREEQAQDPDDGDCIFQAFHHHHTL